MQRFLPGTEMRKPIVSPHRALMCLVPLLSFAQQASAQILEVPGQFTTIQAAIVSANDGDTVHVSPGVYHEAINFLGKNIRVVGVAGAEVTTIDATGLDTSVVLFVDREPETTLLQGFTLTGGSGYKHWPGDQGSGGGIYIGFDACPRVRDCIIRDNHASGDGSGGGGVFISDSIFGTPRIERCVIRDNSASGSGGVACDGAELIDCKIVHNWAKGVGGVGAVDSRIEGCLIAANTAEETGGLSLYSPSGPIKASLTRTTIRDNVAFNDTGGGYISLHGEQVIVLDGLVVQGNVAGHFGGGLTISAPFALVPNVIRNSLIADNTSGSSTSGMSANQKLRFEHCTIVGNSASSPDASFTHCILRQVGTLPLGAPIEWSNVEGGYPGTGNFDADPLFIDEASGDYHLVPGSPCRDQGDPAFVPLAGELDVDGEARVVGGRTDIGGDEYADCDGNGAPDALDIAQGVLSDCDGTGVPDVCEGLDCNGNGLPDACDITQGLSEDCDEDGIPDDCEWLDCNANGVLDTCDIVLGLAEDCNGNGVPDSCDILVGTSFDDDLDGVPDSCQGVVHVPQDVADIAEALDLVDTSGTILVAPGVWTDAGFIGNFSIAKANLLIEGVGGASACVLDASFTLDGWTIAGADGGWVTVRGFTFRGASAGMLALVSPARVRFEDCIFEDNHSAGGTMAGGGAVDMSFGTEAVFVRCTLRGNSSTLGGAIRVRGPAVLDHCTFLDNVATTAGGSLRAQAGAPVTLTNSIAWGGSAPTGPEFALSNGAQLSIDYSDVEGGQAAISAAAGVLNWGVGNIASDPLFVDGAAGDLHLQDGSPCINAGDPAGPLDADGSASEMGAWPWSPWSLMGGGIGGDWGVPTLSGQGALLPGNSVSIELASARPDVLAGLFVGLPTGGAPFKGGIFWPMPIILTFVPVGAGGQVELETLWPPGAPGNWPTCFQAWLADDTAPKGFAGSNGLKGVTPP
jgi:Right handed beta helix region